MEAAAWLAGELTHDTSQLTSELSGEKVKIAGFVTGVRRILTKNKSQMAVLMLEDLHGSVEAVVFPRVYERAAELFREDAILIVEGKVDTRSDRPQIVVDRAASWTAPPKGSSPPPPRPEVATPRMGANGTHAAAETEPSTSSSGLAAANDRAHKTDGSSAATNGSSHAAGSPKRVLRVVVPRGEDDNACLRVLEQLHVLVERFPGSDEIQLVLHDRSGGRIELAGADIPIEHSADLETQVRSLVGPDNVEVVATSL
jgi:DNA polymerase-3 subunit alpha